MIDPLRLKKLLQRMIDIYSPSGKEEDLLYYLKGYLKRRGLKVQAQPVDDNRYNLVLAPDDRDIQLAFVGHLDTVTAYDLEQYSYVEKGDEIMGLGAADMKGGCAAMIEAFMAFTGSASQVLPVALCLVVGEEETGDGAAQLMKQYRFPWAVIGEPTALVPCFKSYGYVETQISAEGKRLHASLAGRRKNSVETLLGRLLKVTHFFEHNHPGLIYNIRDLYTIPAGFAVPEYSEAWIDIHLPPGASTGEIITELDEMVSFRDRANPGINVLFRTETIDAGYDLPDKGLAADILKSVYQERGLAWKTDAFRSHSDANQIFASGARPILLGPGCLEKAHVQDESVPLAEVQAAAEIYLSLMQRFFADPSSSS
ncbi:MAG: M20/M25/M40 family metallo-hydrolase [Pseudomonadota bacterium]